MQRSCHQLWQLVAAAAAQHRVTCLLLCAQGKGKAQAQAVAQRTQAITNQDSFQLVSPG